jgi:hypothetical protein
MKSHVFKLRALLIVNKYECPNVVYQSDGHPIIIIFCCFRLHQQS